ncbi:GntR family transcriptional regulator, partial [Escherichia coli]
MKGADFVVRINKASSKPYYEQLVLSIKEDILNGVLT